MYVSLICPPGLGRSLDLLIDPIDKSTSILMHLLVVLNIIGSFRMTIQTMQERVAFLFSHTWILNQGIKEAMDESTLPSPSALRLGVILKIILSHDAVHAISQRKSQEHNI